MSEVPAISVRCCVIPTPPGIPTCGPLSSSQLWMLPNGTAAIELTYRLFHICLVVWMSAPKSCPRSLQTQHFLGRQRPGLVGGIRLKFTGTTFLSGKIPSPGPISQKYLSDKPTHSSSSLQWDCVGLAPLKTNPRPIQPSDESRSSYGRCNCISFD